MVQGPEGRVQSSGDYRALSRRGQRQVLRVEEADARVGGEGVARAGAENDGGGGVASRAGVREGEGRGGEEPWKEERAGDGQRLVDGEVPRSVQRLDLEAWEVDVRLLGKDNSNSHGASETGSHNHYDDTVGFQLRSLS